MPVLSRDLHFLRYMSWFIFSGLLRYDERLLFDLLILVGLMKTYNWYGIQLDITK